MRITVAEIYQHIKLETSPGNTLGVVTHQTCESLGTMTGTYRWTLHQLFSTLAFDLSPFFTEPQSGEDPLSQCTPAPTHFRYETKKTQICLRKNQPVRMKVDF